MQQSEQDRHAAVQSSVFCFPRDRSLQQSTMSRQDLLDTRKFPAQQHARKVFTELLKSVAAGTDTITVYLEGDPTKYRHDTDRQALIR